MKNLQELSITTSMLLEDIKIKQLLESPYCPEVIVLNEQGIAHAVIAGAARLCAQEPDHFACQPIAEPTPITMTDEHRRTLEGMAQHYHFGGGALRRQRSMSGRTGENRESENGSADVWQTGENGDCEDRMLHAWHTLRTQHPEIARGVRPVMFCNQPGRDGRTSGPAHIALEIHTDQGVHVLDTARSSLRPMSDYSDQRVYHAEGENGVGGRWTHRPDAETAAPTPATP